MVLAAVAGGLRQLLAGRGESVGQLVLRAMVPISLHHEQPGQARGNQDTVMLVPLPLGEPDPVRRLRLIAAETAARKRKARPQMGSGIFRFAPSSAPGTGSWPTSGPSPHRHQRPRPAAAAASGRGAAAGALPRVSLMGNVTLAVAVFSYAGQLNLTAVADHDTCPDVEVFAQGVQDALADLAQPAPAAT